MDYNIHQNQKNRLVWIGFVGSLKIDQFDLFLKKIEKLKNENSTDFFWFSWFLSKPLRTGFHIDIDIVIPD
jgi:hypothetical protein